MGQTYLMTDHAIAQLDIRLIGRDILDLLMRNGDRKVVLAGGLKALSISKRRLQELRHRGIAAAIIERAAKIVAVLGPTADPTDERPVVITVMRSYSNAGGRYRRSRGRT